MTFYPSVNVRKTRFYFTVLFLTILAEQLPPGTPHHYKYYSERVVGSASSSKVTLVCIYKQKTGVLDQ